jgi:hypothetical protein
LKWKEEAGNRKRKQEVKAGRRNGKWYQGMQGGSESRK